MGWGGQSRKRSAELPGAAVSLAAPPAMMGAMTPIMHARLRDWVEEMRVLCVPERVQWCDGSDGEYQALCALLVAAGTFAPVPKRPGSFICRTHPSDTARVEERTFICTRAQADAGPTNHWSEPEAMK